VASVVVLVICTVFLIVQKRSLEKALSVVLRNVNEYDYKKQLAETKITTLETYLILSAQSNGKIIPENISLTDVKNNKHTTAEVFAGKTPSLVFRYSYNDCGPCVNTVFEYLWQLKNSIAPNKLRIIILPHYTELRQMIVENTQSFKNQFTFYMTNENGIGLPIDSEWLPYLAIVDDNKQAGNIFVVDVAFQPLLEKYFKALMENYE